MFTGLEISKTAATPNPMLLTLAQTEQGWDFHFLVASGYHYRIQRATNLAGPWRDIGILTGPATGMAEFIDVNIPIQQCFYRTVTP